MRQFSIKELERFSGIKAHTLRIWENRYGVFNPQRTAGNIRTYSLEDVDLLLHISLLINNGYKISQLAKLEATEISRKTDHLLTEEGRQEKVVYELIVAMFSSDIDKMEQVLNDCISARGIDITIRNIIIPFLNKAELLSYKDTSPETHFAVTAIRKKLIIGIESIQLQSLKASTALMFLPKGEHYDLLLLYITYILKSKGLRILYLGTNISGENLEKVVMEKKPDLLFTYLSSRHVFHIEELTKFLRLNVPEATLFIAEEENMARKTSADNVEFFHYPDVGKVIDGNLVG